MWMLVHPASNGDDEKENWLKSACIAAGYHAEGNASSLLMVSMASSFCMYRVRDLTSRLSSSAACCGSQAIEKRVSSASAATSASVVAARELYTVRFSR